MPAVARPLGTQQGFEIRLHDGLGRGAGNAGTCRFNAVRLSSSKESDTHAFI